MPTYDYRCPECGYTDEVVHSIKISPEIHCDKCLSQAGKPVPMERLISGNPGGFIVKGGGIMAAYNEKMFRHKKNAALELRQMEHYGEGPRLQPNVAGLEVDSWKDAAKLAKEAGMSADSYAPHIEKEKHVGKTSNIDDKKWKKAKEKKAAI